MPKDFDYKKELTEALTKKHLTIMKSALDSDYQKSNLSILTPKDFYKLNTSS